jgi:hypothetical protein
MTETNPDALVRKLRSHAAPMDVADSRRGCARTNEGFLGAC